MQKKISTFLFIFLTLVFFTGCESTPARPIKVGSCAWPGYEPLFLAAQLKMYDKPIKLLRFSSPAKAYRAFKSGAIDVVALTTDELLKYADYSSVPKIFLILDISNGADALVSIPDIKTIEELKGKTVALESSVLSQYILSRVLQKANLTSKDINIKNIEIIEQPKAYKDKEADAFVTYEPSKGSLIQQGGHVLFDSSMLPNEIVDALAANEKTWKNSQEAIQSLKRGWYKALDYIKEHPQKAYKIMGELEGITADEFEQSLIGLNLGERDLNKQLITEKKLVEPLKKLQRVLLEKKIIHKELDPLLFIGE